MTAIRRILILSVLTVAVIAGASVPAWAYYTDAASVSTTVATGTVAAPTAVSITGRCQGWWYDFTVSWPASTTTRGVTGYRVLAYLNTGTTYLVGETDAATRTISMTVDSSNLALQPRITVTTLTSYGWTTESAKSPVLTC
jgi:predicted ribosomally synthesized peptide with SipW-like signal peptide